MINGSPIFSVKNMTSEEAWNGEKPLVHYFKVFGCIAHVHIPDVHGKKLDDKSIKCVFLRVNEESKARRLYDPVSKRILIKKDVMFEESKGGNGTSMTKKKKKKL